MHTIEPCCATKQIMMLRDSLGKSGTTQFRGYGVLSLTEVLPALLTRYTETEMLIIAPALPDQAAEIIQKWMRKQWARMDGKGKLNIIRKMTVIADLSAGKSPMASTWLTENPFGDRLSLIDKAQEDTALLLPDIAVTGPLNMQYGYDFICNVTTIKEQVDALWKQYTQPVKPAKKSAAKKKAEPEEEQTGKAVMAGDAPSYSSSSSSDDAGYNADKKYNTVSSYGVIGDTVTSSALD